VWLCKNVPLHTIREGIAAILDGLTLTITVSDVAEAQEPLVTALKYCVAVNGPICALVNVVEFDPIRE
jgi:hypothetical protein